MLSTHCFFPLQSNIHNYKKEFSFFPICFTYLYALSFPTESFLHISTQHFERIFFIMTSWNFYGFFYVSLNFNGSAITITDVLENVMKKRYGKTFSFMGCTFVCIRKKEHYEELLCIFLKFNWYCLSYFSTICLLEQLIFMLN